MAVKTRTKKVTSDIILDLDVSGENYSFDTTIVDAMSQAELEISQLNETIESVNALKPQCDKLDYILAACSGVLCGLIDVFLVGMPGESPLGNLTDKWFENRVKDFAQKCHPDGKKFDSLKSALSFLEEKFKVPYDQTGVGDAGKKIFGLNPTNHHFKSLAHNPSLLGLFFSILNQFTDTSTFVSDGQIITLKKASGNDQDGKWELQGGNVVAKLFCGFVNWFGHLMSDVAGSESSAKRGTRGMGIPSPLWTWTNDIVVIKNKLNIPVSEFDKNLNQLSQELFEKGFDARFQTTQTIPVVLNELIVRLIYSIRRMVRYFKETKKEDRSLVLLWKSCEPFSNATVKRMLTVAHGAFCLVDIGDAVIRGFASGGGSFNPVVFFLRLNVAGVGRFAISLFGETKRAIVYHRAKAEADFAKKQRIIVENYIEGLRVLAEKYDDADLIIFVTDFENSDAYKELFQKSVALAQLRGVPEDRILKSKADIDKRFGGCSDA